MVRDPRARWEHCNGLLGAREARHNGYVHLRNCALSAWLLLAAPALAGCESAEDKCSRLQQAAVKGWASYEQVLKRDSDSARAAADGAEKKLKGGVQKRLEAEARKHADQLHGSEHSSAWWRTFDAAQQALCAKDAECMELKGQAAEAKAKLADLNARLGTAKAAASSATSDPEVAANAASAVQDDFERAEIKPARAASAEAVAACNEAKPEN
jgi:hypothetical protein